MGFKIAMYSTASVLTVHHALTELYSTIAKDCHTQNIRHKMSTFPEYRSLVDEGNWNDIGTADWCANNEAFSGSPPPAELPSPCMSVLFKRVQMDDASSAK